MKVKIKDKRKILQFALAVLIVIIILTITFPHILNAVFGNSIKEEIITVTTDVISEIDVDFTDGCFALYNSQGLKKYNTKGEFETVFLEYGEIYIPKSFIALLKSEAFTEPEYNIAKNPFVVF